MESLGEYLKRERELRGITIEEIANITRISSRFIQALENDDFKNLPSDVFVKGFLRAYTKCVGINPNEIISIYNRIKKIDEKSEVKKDDIAPKMRFNNTTIIASVSAIAFLLIISIGGFYYYKRAPNAKTSSDKKDFSKLKAGIVEQPKKEDTEMKEEIPLPQAENGIDLKEQKPVIGQPKEEIVKTIPAATAGNIAKFDEPAEKKQEPLKLTITAMETVWFSIVIDDSETKEAILQPNKKMIFEAKEKFSLTTGNISGTDVTLDGVKVTLPATRSNVLKNYILSREQ